MSLKLLMAGREPRLWKRCENKIGLQLKTLRTTSADPLIRRITQRLAYGEGSGQLHAASARDCQFKSA